MQLAERERPSTEAPAATPTSARAPARAASATTAATPGAPAVRAARAAGSAAVVHPRIAAESAAPEASTPAARVAPTVRAMERAAREQTSRALVSASPVGRASSEAVSVAPLADAADAPARRAAIARAASTGRVTAERGAVGEPEGASSAPARLAERVVARSAKAASSAIASRSEEREERGAKPVASVDRSGAAPETVLARRAEVAEAAPVATTARKASAKATAKVAVKSASPTVASATPVAKGAAAVAARAIAASSPRVASARHAVRRAEAFRRPEMVAQAEIQRAADGVVARRVARRRAVAPAMAHVADDFQLTTMAPVASSDAPSRVARAEGTAVGPVTRTTLGDVLGRVSAAVRAMERADQSTLVSPSARRLADEPDVSAPVSARRVRAQRVIAGEGGRFERSARTVDGVMLTPAAPIGAAETSTAASPRTSPVVRAVARAERRAAIGAASNARSASAQAPGARAVRRAFAGSEGLSGGTLDTIVARALAPVGERAPGSVVRYRTMRTPEGRFQPMAAEAFAPAAARYGLGRIDIPRRASVNMATGLVMPSLAPIAVDEPNAPQAAGRSASPARRAGAVAAEGTPLARRAAAVAEGVTPGARAARIARAADGRPARTEGPARASRSFVGTMGYLRTGETEPDAFGASEPAVRKGPVRRTSIDDSGTVVAARQTAGAQPAFDGGSSRVPSYAARAVEGTLTDTAGVRPVGLRLSPHLATGGLLTALARADRPEDVVQVILQRGGSQAELNQELPEAARMVERIVRLGGEAARSAAVDAAPATQLLGGAASSASSSSSRVRRASAARPANGQGSSQVMRLAQKLMNLIHLAESDRKADEAQRQVRMAEASAEARSDGSASVAAGQTKNVSAENVNISALQREVLEAVLRELELNHHRRQEDNDVWW